MRRTFCAVVLVLLAGSFGHSYFQRETAAPSASALAKEFLTSLDAAQKEKTQLAWNAENRFDWHFIPKPQRKGLQLSEMTPTQHESALKLLAAVLSESGYKTARQTMQNELMLKQVEGPNGQNIRDPERYYYTIFGDPAGSENWGLSIEGHHLSLNFVLQGEKFVSSTPQAFCSNPAVVKSPSEQGLPVGTRPIDLEETLAFELVKGLSAEQKTKAIFAQRAPREVREPGTKQAPRAAAEGIAYPDLQPAQQELLKKLIAANCDKMPEAVRNERTQKMEAAGIEKVHFAWAGGMEEGVGHYYKIQGPTFLIEFVNTQPDVNGNPANHIHCVFRDMQGDFGVPVEG